MATLTEFYHARSVNEKFLIYGGLVFLGVIAASWFLSLPKVGDEYRNFTPFQNGDIALLKGDTLLTRPDCQETIANMSRACFEHLPRGQQYVYLSGQCFDTEPNFLVTKRKLCPVSLTKSEGKLPYPQMYFVDARNLIRQNSPRIR